MLSQTDEIRPVGGIQPASPGIEGVCRMNKHDLIAVVSRSAGKPKSVIRNILELILARIKRDLWRGERVVLGGFGTFRVRERKARKGDHASKYGLPRVCFFQVILW
jgi:nucleoid DNA-binding protein